MLLDDKQREFIEKIVWERKNIYTAAKELEMPVDKLVQWYDELFDEISRQRTEQTLNIMEKYDLSRIGELEYYGQLHKRLRDELNNRDFSGLPTDKVYFLLSDIREKIDNIIKRLENHDNHWDEDFLEDEFYDDEDDY